MPLCEPAPAPTKTPWKSPTWVTQELSKFSNRPEVARDADQTLIRLIEAKSPLIREWFATRGFQRDSSETSQAPHVSEDVIARAWREYYARMFVLSRGPVPTLTQPISEKAFPESLRKKWAKLFDQAGQSAIKAVEGFAISAENKKAIVQRLRGVTLAWSGGTALEFLEWGIAYQPATQKIQIGLRALAYPNETTLFAVFAHELGHAFDSCRWGAFFTGPFPFQKVADCLRSARSVGARKRDDTKLEEFQKNGSLNPELLLALRANPTCNKAVYPPIGVQADQLPEAFADWFSAMVVKTAKISTKGLRADLCAPDERQPGSSYPSNQDRLEKIYFAGAGVACEL